jgi:hypothetical protein
MPNDSLFSSETMEARKKWHGTRKELQSRILYPAKMSFRGEPGILR